MTLMRLITIKYFNRLTALLFLATGLASNSVCAITAPTLSGWLRRASLWCSRRRRRQSLFKSETAKGTAFGLYSMHNANVLGHWGFVPPFTINDFRPFRPFSHPREQSYLPDFTCFTCNTCLLTIPFKNIGGQAAVIGLIWLKCREATRGDTILRYRTYRPKKWGGGGLDSVIDNSKTL